MCARHPHTDFSLNIKQSIYTVQYLYNMETEGPIERRYVDVGCSAFTQCGSQT